MPKILVALDGSPGSEKALEAAVRLAQKDGRQVTAVSVLDRSGDPRLEQLAEGVKAQARRHLEEILQAAVNFARSRGVLLTAVLREGHPAEAILACAEQEGVEVLVLGSAGSEAARLGLGGTADQVSSHAPCTVMLVK
ncbi:MAG: universal stress protein [Gemmataceae bacterium]|nr:universal stress protein [Gemmataceae bacterium]